MDQPHSRPVFLNPLQIRLPAAAVLSIAHRLAGLVMALLIPGLIYLLDMSLRGPAGFARAMEWLHSGAVRVLVALMSWALLHHLLAGVRFLLIDMGVGIDRGSARASAWLVMIVALLAAILIFGALA